MPTTTELVFDAVGVMIPVVTGFLVLFAGSVGKLWERGRDKKDETDTKIAWKTAILVAVIEILAIGFFAGAMAFGIMHSTGAPQKLFFMEYTVTEALVCARYYVGYGYSLFIAGIVAAMGFYYLTLRSSAR